jgi:hypothetical protein
VHTPLINDDTFAQAQDIFSSRARTIAHSTKRTRNSCILRGTMRHSMCGREMREHRSRGEPSYRCRFVDEYAPATRIQHPRNVCFREALVLLYLDNWISKVFLPQRLNDTIDLMAGAPPVQDGQSAAAEAARKAIADCEAKLAIHRAALEAGADPGLVTQWIAETQARKTQAEAKLRTTISEPGTRLTRTAQRSPSSSSPSTIPARSSVKQIGRTKPRSTSSSC